MARGTWIAFGRNLSGYSHRIIQDLIFDEYGWFYEDHINEQRNRVCGIAAAVVITELGSFGSPVSLRPLT